jgi:spore cortex biosynthesis protein YabQ
MVAHQGVAFLYCAYVGMLLGVAFDTLSFVRRMIRAGKLVTALFDLFFWLLCSAAALYVLFVLSSGQVRVFLLAGMAAGGGLYAAGIHPILSSIRKRMSTKINSWSKRPGIWRLLAKLFR